VRQRFTKMEQVASLPRTRHGIAIQNYRVYSLSGPIGPPLDPP